MVLEGMGEVLRRGGKAQNQRQQAQPEHQQRAVAPLPSSLCHLGADGVVRAGIHGFSPLELLGWLPSSLIGSPSRVPDTRATVAASTGITVISFVPQADSSRNWPSTLRHPA